MKTLFVFICSIVLFQCGSASEQLWIAHCTPCHGVDGRGKTPTGRMLRLFDFTENHIQRQKTDEQMKKAIINGVKNEVGQVRMQAFESLLSDEEIDSLIEYIRNFKK